MPVPEWVGESVHRWAEGARDSRERVRGDGGPVPVSSDPKTLSVASFAANFVDKARDQSPAPRGLGFGPSTGHTDQTETVWLVCPAWA